MRRVLAGAALACVMSAPVWCAGDDLKFPVSFEKLGERASESVDVTLDESMLRLASGFLSHGDPDEAQVKKLVAKLKGVYVRSFEFDKDGEYSLTDVESLRAQLRSPEWSRIVGVHSNRGKGENTDIFLKKHGDAIEGLVVIAAEPRELTVVHIDGPINPEELSELGGHMGIPNMDRSGRITSKKKEED